MKRSNGLNSRGVGPSLGGPVLSAVLFLSLAGCGADSDLRKARKSEKLGRYSTAIGHYENFIGREPEDDRAPEALFRIGEIYRTVVKDYERARDYYAKIMEVYSKSDWSRSADLAFMNSPDYFPFDPGKKKVLGDSQSGGDIMRLTEVSGYVDKKENRLKVLREIFAGDKRVSTAEIFFEKKDNELREFRSGETAFAVILRYPPEKGLKWETVKDNKRIRYTIEDDDVTLNVGGETYEGCLRVKQQEVRRPGTWKVEYYAPWVGHVLTSAATRRKETRIMEMLAYEDRGEHDPKVEGASKFMSLVKKLKFWSNEK